MGPRFALRDLMAKDVGASTTFYSSATCRAGLLIGLALVANNRARADSGSAEVELRLPSHPPCEFFTRARLEYDDFAAADALRLRIEGLAEPLEVTRKGDVPVRPGPLPASIRMRVLSPITKEYHRATVRLACAAGPASVKLEWTSSDSRVVAYYPAGSRPGTTGEMTNWGCPGPGNCPRSRHAIAKVYDASAAEVKRRHDFPQAVGIIGSAPARLAPQYRALAQALARDAAKLVAEICVEDRCGARVDQVGPRLAALTGGKPAVGRVVADSVHLEFRVGPEEDEVACTSSDAPTCKLTLWARPPFRGATVEISPREHESLIVGQKGFGAEGGLGRNSSEPGEVVVWGVALR
jgi:hypothetical protein